MKNSTVKKRMFENLKISLGETHRKRRPKAVFCVNPGCRFGKSSVPETALAGPLPNKMLVSPLENLTFPVRTLQNLNGTQEKGRGRKNTQPKSCRNIGKTAM